MKIKMILVLSFLLDLWISVGAKSSSNHSFVIEDNLFLKDGFPFRIIGGDLHYFRIHPLLWEDRLLRAKALGLNTIQTYVPWNLHEPRPGLLNFNGFADLLLFLKLAQKLDLLVMLRIGPYICAEWDLGGLPAWLLELKPSVRLRSSDAYYLSQVESWWKKLLPKIAPELFSAGGPVIMVQIENEYGSFGIDRLYLQFLLKQVRSHLGNDVIIYTTDGAVEENLSNGSLSDEGVFAAIDFPTGSNPAAAFALQKRFNPPGMSPPLSAEFYTGWLTHWGERLAQTDAKSTAVALDDILRLNASVVLYMVHGGTNFGFWSGANTGVGPSDFHPDITSYDYDAPIGEAGDITGNKYQEIRKVLRKYADGKLPDPPPLPQRTAYGKVIMTEMGSLFDVLEVIGYPPSGVKLEWPVPTKHLRQASGFILYRACLPSSVRSGSKISVVEVHDRAQIFVVSDTKRRMFLGTLERWSSNSIILPAAAAVADFQLDILVENMGRVNYGRYMGEYKGITEAVFLDEDPILGWTVQTIELDNISELGPASFTATGIANCNLNMTTTKVKPTIQPLSYSNLLSGPVFYEGALNVTEPSDTFISFDGWKKGAAFVNGFNLGRFWPIAGPQCTLYVPGPLLRRGENKLIILELEGSQPVQTVEFKDRVDFTCGSYQSDIPY